MLLHGHEFMSSIMQQPDHCICPLSFRKSIQDANWTTVGLVEDRKFRLTDKFKRRSTVPPQFLHLCNSNTYAFTTLSKKSSMYWKYPGSATVSLWLPLGNSRHVLGALQIWYKRAICDALS